VKRPEYLAKWIQSFFLQRLSQQRDASPNTVTSYGDAFSLLLRFAQKQVRKSAAKLEIGDLDAPLITRFLDYLEIERGNCPRTRNARLAAIHSFFTYLAPEVPEHLDQIRKVLAIPPKRWQAKPIDYLERDELRALLDAPDLDTWSGRRDRAILAVLAHTGFRVSELTALSWSDVELKKTPQICCEGKGRKKRNTLLSQTQVDILVDWRREQPQTGPCDPVFLNARGRRLSRDGVSYLLKKQVETAAQSCPSLKDKRVTPHSLRHTCAMDLLHSGVDRSLIAIWLGHESMDSTEPYVHADLALKEKILEKMAPMALPPGRFRPGDTLLALLDELRIMPSEVARSSMADSLPGP
jgi:integrase/recombinase XerD